MNTNINKALHAPCTRIRKMLPLLGAAFVLFAGFCLARTARYNSSVPHFGPLPEVTIPEGAGERLAGSLRFRTISYEDPTAFDEQEFQDLHAYLVKVFPQVHSQLWRETVGTHSLLYTWKGEKPSLKPILLIGHIDTVPVEPGTKHEWSEDPFGGRIADGFIWGRGAIDNKSAVIGILDAVEMLLAEGFRPGRTVYLAFGHDEEVGGTAGAREVAALLQRRGVEFEMVLDEGGVIGEGIFPGISSPIAMVGIAEKGFVSIELIARAAGGHSALPPRQTTIGLLSAAIARLEEYPMPARMESPTRQLFDRIGPHLPFIQRALFANLWLSQPLVMRNLEANSTSNAMVRTTTAPTIVQAGSKDNLLPSAARAVINFRILPGDTIGGVLEHVRRVIRDGRIEIKTVGRFSSEPSPVSSTKSLSFEILERTISRLHPDAIVAPYQVVVTTDARHYAALSKNIFRFLPLRVTAKDLVRMHGIDERIATEQYEMAIRFYRQLILDGAAS
jgi:carboxypeptidase PM20D1